MENFKQFSESAQDMILAYFKNRMKEQNITQKKLSEITGVSVTTLIRYFKKETPMPLGVYLEICGALDFRTYIIPSEMDENKMHRMFFNTIEPFGKTEQLKINNNFK